MKTGQRFDVIIAFLCSARFLTVLTTATIGAAALSFALQQTMGWAGLLGVLGTMLVLWLIIILAKRGEIEWNGLLPISLMAFIALAGASIFWSNYQWATLGSLAYLDEQGVSTGAARVYLTEADATESTVFVSQAGRLIGRFGLADTIKPNARAAIQALQQQGLTTVLLTGDSRTAAEEIADTLGIDRVSAEVLPAEKGDAIRELQAAGERVAMVGDGINDAVALAAADLGLAVVSGTDIALKSADVILVREDLAVIPEAIELSRRTLRTIRVNLGWAFGYNLAAIPIAAAGFLNPLIAAGAMALSSVLVVFNSLRLQNYRRRI